MILGRLLVFLFVISLSGCQNHNSSASNISTDSSNKSVYIKIDSKKSTKESLLEDEVIQVYQKDDTIRFSKKRLDMASKLIPEFTMELIPNPDLAYNARPMPSIANNDEEKDFLSFACEVCKDDYFLMYTYFLRQKNKGKAAEKYRLKLIEIYRLINSVHRKLNSGGTFFSHQHYRIYAYAEYSVYLKVHYGEDYEKNYAVSINKGFFLGSIKQLILDDEKYNMDVLQSEKRDRKIKMLKDVEKLNGLITDHFYLNQSEKFNYTLY